MKKTSYFLIIAFIGLLFYSGYNIMSPAHRKMNREKNVAELDIDRIVIEKRDRKMYLLHKGKAVREYAVDLGADPEGPKEKEGDRKTPEGIYKISGRNPNSRYYLSLRISYPNRKDRERAEKAGVSPGGDIMIHGLPNISTIFGFRTKLKKDWTLGCIAVQTNEEMLEIWHLVKDGTIVEIKP